ncbi:MAG TPA: sulfurtransferase [Steroidobacteraceae bacterium]|nr:sulfurtransferase [Steroidobacteraceae bacterium]
MHTTLIEPAELAVRVSEPDWAVVDCRFDLSRPQWGAGAYAAEHIPHAVYAHLDRDLSGAATSESGRHPLPALADFAATMSRLGIDQRVQVVSYDQGNGALAARLWWLLRWAGHLRVAVLNGGLAAWQQSGLPLSSATDTRTPRRFVPGTSLAETVGTREVEEWVADGVLARGGETLIDARAADRFAGQNETIDPVAGHIPGAVSHPFARNLDGQGRFLHPGELRERWLATLGQQAPAQSIHMCGSGVTACHNLLALQVAGLPGARLYGGSWSEWIRDRTRPVAR